MIASQKFMKQFIEKHNIDCLIGSDEINAEKFFEWVRNCPLKFYEKL